MWDGFQGDNNIRDTLRSHVVWYQAETIESRMYPHTWWQCKFEGVVTHLAGDLVRTSTIESKNTGCCKLGTLLRSHLDQGPITYVKGMALTMLVSLRNRLALEVTQNGSGRNRFTPPAVSKLPHVLRTCIHWGIQIINVRKNTAVKTAVQALIKRLEIFQDIAFSGPSEFPVLPGIADGNALVLPEMLNNRPPWNEECPIFLSGRLAELNSQVTGPAAFCQEIGNRIDRVETLFIGMKVLRKIEFRINDRFALYRKIVCRVRGVRQHISAGDPRFLRLEPECKTLKIIFLKITVQAIDYLPFEITHCSMV